MKYYRTKLEISDTGKIATIRHENGRAIAEFYVDGPLAVAAYNVDRQIPVKKGRVNIFRGELQALDRDEMLDIANEVIRTRAEDAAAPSTNAQSTEEID